MCKHNKLFILFLFFEKQIKLSAYDKVDGREKQMVGWTEERLERNMCLCELDRKTDITEREII